MYASWKRHNDIVKLLLDQKGIDLDVIDYWGRTALMNAIENGHIDVAQMLLDHTCL